MRVPFILTVVAGLALCAAPARAGGPVPYRDDRVAGHLGFCDARGHAVTGGPLTDAPFAAKVVSDAAPSSSYDGKGAGAFVLAFQPRRGVDPGAWSGEQITASSTYTDRTHPSAEVTFGDVSLLQVSQDYPPQWDGLLQLRLYTKAPQAAVYSARYAAADVRIAAGRWQVVDPVTLPCTSGTATSVARALAPDSVASPTPSAGRTTPPAGAPVPSGAVPSDGTTWVLPVSLLAGLLASAGGLLGWRRLNTS